MSTFVSVEFSNANGSGGQVAAYPFAAGESGGPIIANGGFAPNAIVTAAGRVRNNQSGPSAYYFTGSPAGTDYSVQGDLFFADAPATSSQPTQPDVSTFARMDTDTFSGYNFQWDTPTLSYQLSRWNNATQTRLDAGTNPTAGSVTASPAAGSTTTIKLSVAGSGDTVTVTAYVNGTVAYTYADTSASRITTAGKAGFHLYGTSSSTTGVHIGNFVAADANTATPTPTPTPSPTPSPTVTLPVNSPAAKFSPGNWAGDAGRGGAAYRRSWNNGASQQWAWSTNSSSPSAVLNVTNSTSGSAISYDLNGTFVDNVTVPTSGGVTLTGAKTGTNALTVYNRNSQQSGRWADGNAFTVTGLTLDAGATAGTAPPARPWVLFVSDSIGEGILAADGSDDWLSDYSFALTRALDAAGYDTCISACGYSGWVRPGDSGGDVPGYYPVVGGTYVGAADARQGRIDSATSLLDSAGQISAYGATGTPPAAIVYNYGINETLIGTATADVTASVAGALAADRAAAPTAVLLVIVPFGLYATSTYASGPAYVAAVRAGVAQYRTAHPSDARVQVLDLGADASGVLSSAPMGSQGANSVHPGKLGHLYVAGPVVAAVVSALSVASAPTPTKGIGAGPTSTPFPIHKPDGTAVPDGTLLTLYTASAPIEANRYTDPIATVGGTATANVATGSTYYAVVTGNGYYAGGTVANPTIPVSG